MGMPFRLAGVDEGRTGRLEFGERRAMGRHSCLSIRGRSEPTWPAQNHRGQEYCARHDSNKQADDHREQPLDRTSHAIPPRQRLT